MQTTYFPKGVCSRQMDVEIENGIVKNVNIIGGCNGNTQGISKLVEGMPAEEAVKRMRGIRCNGKASSCPDQLADAIENAMREQK